MSKINIFLKFIFHFSVILLIVLSLFPGSLMGLLLYGDLYQQPNLIDNPFGTSINHFISYFFVSILGLSLFLKSEDFKKILLGLIFLSIILEVLQFIVPNRSFQLTDLIANILGVMVAYFVIKIYLFFK
tara:strand:- start:258 stop:644 length:387 start_codon:yes stop_codon:yes gene_type:complete